MSVLRWSMLSVLAACSSPFEINDDKIGSDTESSSDVEESDTELDATDTETDAEPVDGDGDGSFSDEDCDDGDETVYPGAEELCDGQDNDCDGLKDGEGDADGDGIYDCEDYCPIQVDQSAASGGDGSFVAPFQVVQDGIDAAPPTGCYEVEVHPGTYVENIDFSGIDVDVRGVDGPSVTVLDGSGSGPVVTIDSGETSAARLTGFTVTDGSAERGGGVYISGSDPVIEGNVITGNAASGSPASGGGIYLQDSDSEIVDNEITSNSAGMGGDDDGNDGGGMTILYGAPRVQGNLIQDNEAGDGGGIWVARSDALILHNIIDGNAADDAGVTDDNGYTLTGQGGGVDFQADTDGVVFTNNIVTNNSAGSHGGGIAAIGYYVDTDVAEPTIRYNVVAFNQVDGAYGAGICVWGIGTPSLTGNIVADNGESGIYSQYDSAVVTYNLASGNGEDFSGGLEGLAGTDGNLEASPKFTSVSDDGDVGNDDFTLKGSSPAVDAADPDDSDADGSAADMGAYGGPQGSW